MNDSQLAYIGLGANLGDSINQLLSARTALAMQPFISSMRSSAMYASSPVGYDDQPDFINCVVELGVGVEARQLFAKMQEIEIVMGRTRDANNQNAARLIDIDLLLFGEETIRDSDLLVPHPRIAERLFVLKPLGELRPDLMLRFETSQHVCYEGQDLHRLSL